MTARCQERHRHDFAQHRCISPVHEGPNHRCACGFEWSDETPPAASGVADELTREAEALGLYDEEGDRA